MSVFRIFVGLAVFGVLLFVAAGVIGFVTHNAGGDHMLLGVGVGIYLCGLHTVTMFHLIGTSKETKEAAKELPEYGEIVAVIRESKMRAFPIITFTLLATIVMVVLGGGVDPANKSLPLWVHHVTVAVALILNVYTFWIEYGAVKLNLLLMTVVDYKVEEKNSKREPANG